MLQSFFISASARFEKIRPVEIAPPQAGQISGFRVNEYSIAAVYGGSNKGSNRNQPGDTIENADMNASLCVTDFAEEAIRRLASAL